MTMNERIGAGLRTVVVCALLGGCAFTHIRTSWSKPGAPPGEFERVSATCEHDSGLTGLKGEAGYDVCMRQHGWFLIKEPAQNAPHCKNAGHTVKRRNVP